MNCVSKAWLAHEKELRAFIYSRVREAQLSEACCPKKMQHDDADIIHRCDLEGMSQSEYAKYNGLTLSATKSRIQRARKRLKMNCKAPVKSALMNRGMCVALRMRLGEVEAFSKELIS